MFILVRSRIALKLGHAALIVTAYEVASADTALSYELVALLPPTVCRLLLTVSVRALFVSSDRFVDIVNICFDILFFLIPFLRLFHI